MMNTKTSYALLPPGVNCTISSLYRLGNALVLFDTELQAKEWLDTQITDNKSYFKIIEVCLVLNEGKTELKAIDTSNITIMPT